MQRHAILPQVDTTFTTELVCEPVDNALIEVITTQMRITIGALDLKNTITQFEKRNVEGTTTKIIDADTLILFLIQSIRKRCSGRFVNDTQHFQSRNPASILGSLALCIIEVSWHSDNSLSHTLTEVRFGISFELLQDHRRDFRRTILFALNLYPGIAITGSDNFIGYQPSITIHLGIIVLAAHKALDRVDRIFRIGDSLTLRYFANKSLTTFVHSHNRGCGTRAFRVRNDDRLSTFHNSDTRVCRSQIDSNNLWHICLLL